MRRSISCSSGEVSCGRIGGGVGARWRLSESFSLPLRFGVSLIGCWRLLWSTFSEGLSSVFDETFSVIGWLLFVVSSACGGGSFVELIGFSVESSTSELLRGSSCVSLGVSRFSTLCGELSSSLFSNGSSSICCVDDGGGFCETGSGPFIFTLR